VLGSLRGHGAKLGKNLALSVRACAFDMDRRELWGGGKAPGIPDLRRVSGLLNRLLGRVSDRRENPIPFRLDWNNQFNQTSVALAVADLRIRKNSGGYSVN